MKKNFVLLFTLCAIPALLQAAAPMDPQGAGEQLINAVRDGDKAEVQRFLDEGADIEFTYGFSNQTALMLAASEGHTDIVQMLLDTGADVNPTNLHSETAEQIARNNGHVDIADFIRDYRSGRLVKSARKR